MCCLNRRRVLLRLWAEVLLTLLVGSVDTVTVNGCWRWGGVAGTDTARAIRRMRQMMANQARDQAMKIAVVITDGRSANSTATIQEAVYARQVWGSVHFTLFRTLGRSLCWGSIQFTLLRTLDRSLYWGSIQFTLFRTLGRSPYWDSIQFTLFCTLDRSPYWG